MTKFKLLTAAAIAFVGAASAQAAFVVTVGSPVAVIPGSNDYSAQLAALGLTQYTASGASIALQGTTTVRFAALASESGFVDTFTAGSASYTFSGAGNLDAFAAPIGFGGDTFGPGFAATYTADNASALTAPVGSAGFGIFLPTGLKAGDTYIATTLYFGYDNQTFNDDDNHDDLIVSASVPEPATWAMMIGGFGLVGAGMRRRAAVVTA